MTAEAIPNTTAPALREETQQETASGILGAFQRFIEAMGARPVRSAFGMLFLGMAVIMALFWSKPELFLDRFDAWTSSDLSRQLAEQEIIRTGEEIDKLLATRLLNMRLRTGSARGVVRAYVFARDDQSQIIAVTDVFESMDAKAERTGIRNAPLPLEAIQQTTAYMLANPAYPRCIARNRDEYEDQTLRDFLESAGLKASVACPIVSLEGRILGLIAVSVRTPLERNPDLQRQVRDEALMFSGYWLRSPRVVRAITDAQDRAQ